MTEPGERRPASAAAATTPPDRASRPWSRARSIATAAGVALLAAVAWALLRSVLDISVGSLVVAALGGWAIGASIRRSGGGTLLTVLSSATAWLATLLLAWLVAMAILPESSRTLIERLAATPFLEWLLPQLGLVEIGALVAWVGASWLAVRRPSAEEP